MTSFVWKRKRSLKTASDTTFNSYYTDADEKEGDVWKLDGVDWLTASKRRRAFLLEDNEAKRKRLQGEGAFLAEHGRYWEAIGRWDEALQLNPCSATLHEMKAQALMEVGEAFPAIKSAERSVQLSPCWPAALQTLGRTQLGIGEVHMALRSFEKAVHLEPSCAELLEVDLKWAWQLVRKKDKMAAGQEGKEAQD